jgi:DNA-binding CsgD family transcriptional regulator
LLETIRQYAQEKIGESTEAESVRDRHRDYYTAIASALDRPTDTSLELLLDQVQTELDNLRAAFAWSRETSDTEGALQLATSLQPLWLTRGCLTEGSDWLDCGLADAEILGASVTLATLARALADKAYLDNMRTVESVAAARRAVALARELDDPALLARTLAALGRVTAWDSKQAGPYLSEAAGLARTMGDRWRLSQILYFQALMATLGSGDLEDGITAADEGRALADEIGDRGYSRACRWCLTGAQMVRGDLAGAEKQLRELMLEADMTHALIWQVNARAGLCHVLANTGRAAEGRAIGLESLDGAAELGGYMEGVVYAALAVAALADGAVDEATDASDSAQQRFKGWPWLASTINRPAAQTALARGDLAAARRYADADVDAALGWFTVHALTTRARVALAQREFTQAERDAHEALVRGSEMRAFLFVPDQLEILGALAGAAGRHLDAARIFGATAAIRQRIGVVRFRIYDAGFAQAFQETRKALGETEFNAAWEAGLALSADEVIAYAQRGRGERKRPSSGWDSLTPTELEVVRLVSEGLGNKDVGARLFMSPRTVQTHLTHVYNKLGLTTRMQLAQEAARRA